VSVRSLIGAVIPDTTGNSGKVLTNDGAGTLSWTTTISVTTLTVTTSASIGSTNATNQPLLLNSGAAQMLIGAATDAPTTYTGIWVGATAIADHTTNTYSFLGDSAGSVYLNAATAATGYLRTANANIGSWTSIGFALTMRVWVDAQTTASPLMTNGAFTLIIYGTENADTSSAYNNGTGVFTAPVAGRYQCSATCRFQGLTANAGVFQLGIFKNTAAAWSGPTFDNDNGATSGLAVSATLNLAVNDTIDFRVFQSNGANRNLNNQAFDNRMSILGPF
jgi:hypothetical protein